MKKNLAIIAFLILGTFQDVIYYSEATKEDHCNPGLLETYGLEVVRRPVNDTNFICPGIIENCCTIESQHLIFKYWVQGHERDRLLHVYKTFIATFSLLFDDFKLVEQMAAIVLSQKAPDAVTNCGEMANAIKNITASSLKEDAINLAKKAYRYLYDSRRGFYCSLCDSEAHENYDTLSGVIRMSYGFCSGLIRETMGWTSFQYKFFNKIARLYGHFMSTCQTNGQYDPTHILKFDLKFFDDDKIIETINVCANSLNDNSALGICHKYCERFNPTKFDRMFEGQFDQLLGFRIWLNKQVVGKIYASLTGFSKDDLSFTGRLLADKHPKSRKTQTQTAGQNSASSTQGASSNSTNTTTARKKPVNPFNPDHSSVNQFNSRYNTQALDPVTYRASEDFHVTRLFNYRMSLFQTSKNRVYDLRIFHGLLDKKGINFLKFGYMLRLTNVTLDKLNTQLNLERAIEFTNTTDPFSVNYRYRNTSIQYPQLNQDMSFKIT